MKSNYEPLGKHIRLVDYRNSEEVTSTVLGISIDKEFMPSVANVIGTDLSRYKLISKGLFACNPMHVGRDERLPIALYEKDNASIVSPAYFMFEIIDRDVLNEEYLMMWFRRPEFDRECWFMTDGSVRGGITWDDLCRIKLPVPSYARQCEIVESYRAITDRIALKRAENDNLAATGLAIFKEKFSSPNDGFDETPLYDLAEYINGTSFSEDEYSSDGLPIIKIAELKDGITSATQYFVGNKDTKYLIHDSDVLFSWSGNPDTSIDAFIWSHGDGILNQHTFRMVPRYGVAFTYFMLKFCKPEFVKAAMGKQTTGLGHVTVKDLKRLTLPFNEETAFLFNQAAMPLYEQIFKNLKEINVLIELKNQTVQMLSIINH